MSAVIRVKRLRPEARLPRRATPDSSWFDLYASLEAGDVIVGQYPVLIPTGIAIEAPPGYDVQIRPRSGLARHGVLCTYGTIDADYRGELMVTMYTMALDIEHRVHDGDRIAQIVVSRLAEVAMEEAEELTETERGVGGHGSTGR
jgi:dUTP pyrophosphatase